VNKETRAQNKRDDKIDIGKKNEIFKNEIKEIKESYGEMQYEQTSYGSEKKLPVRN